MASASEPNEAAKTAPPEINPWIVAGAVMLATFMQVLDTSVANVSLPYIAGSMSADIDESTWVLTSYLVSNGIVLPLSGWLASVFGRKRVFLASVALFTVSSFLCGISVSLMMLIFFRILQGAGGGAMQPIAQAILVESFPVERRGTAMAIFGMGVIVAPIIGPTLGGYLTSNFTWRWIFFINIPVGILAIFLASVFVFDPPWLTRERGGRHYIDYIGLGLVALGLGTLQIVLNDGQRRDWFSSRFIVVLTVIAAVSLVIFIVWELTRREPVVDLRLLGERNFAVAVVTMFMLGLALYGSIVLLPIFLQTLLGYTAYLSGLVLSPGGILTLILMPVVGWLVPRIHPRYLVTIGLVIMAYSLFYMAGFNLEVSFWDAVIARAIQGAGLAFLFVPINAVAFNYIAREKTNNATSIINLIRNVGGSVGIAFVTTLLARQTQVHQNDLIGNLTPLNPVYRDTVAKLQGYFIEKGASAALAMRRALGTLYNIVQQQASVQAYLDVFWLLGVIILFVIIPAIFLKGLRRRATPAGEQAML